MPELRVRALCRSFKNGAAEVRAVRNLDLAIPEGTFTVIVGRSGCGKTTLLRLISGLETPDSGCVFFDDGIASGQPPFGFMFQDARLLPWLTVEENLRLAFPAGATRTATQEACDAIDRLLGLVGLSEWKGAYPRRLSGGMAQRIALVRALCRNPRVLLLDEPFGALDAFTRSQLREDMDRLWRSMKLTVLLVTHDIEEAVHLADRVVLMKDGRIDGEIAVPLERPRQRRSADFQELCRRIEGAAGGATGAFSGLRR
ncbi:MAG: ABC transporter ATP-binding protein [Spirochaetaceae bacterium]|jgi:sulfonate transport system ATP-binding protein|nr:ABC transporter ATP-binding protein [Spirochaetaceae bacterium]